MAVVKGPALSLMASGNMGAICYSKWKELQIARGTWTGTVPNTTKQQVYQTTLTTLSQYWGGTLTEAQRESWRAAARMFTFQNRFGESVHYGGYVLFISRNMCRKRWGLAILDLPIVSPGLMLWWTTVMVWQATNHQFVFRARDHPPGEYPHCLEAWYAGPYNSPGRVALPGEYRFIGFDDTPSFYITKVITANQKWYWLKMRFGDISGVVSPFIYEQVQAN